MSVRETISKALLDIDPGLDQLNPSWASAAILLASWYCESCDPETLADTLEMDRGYVAEIGRRASENLIWKDGKCTTSDAWFEDGADTAFWMDVLCLDGSVRRNADDTFSMTDAGMRGVERLLKAHAAK